MAVFGANEEHVLGVGLKLGDGVGVIGDSSCCDDPSGVEVAAEVLDVVPDYLAFAFLAGAPRERD